MTTPVHVTQPATAAGPFRYSMLVPGLAADVIAPIGIFMLLKSFGVSPLWSLAAASLAPAVNNLRIWLRSRRIEPLGIMIISAGAIGTLASLISNSAFYLLVKDSFLTGAFGLAFLASLSIRRPLMFYVIRQFVAGEDAARNRIWEGLWAYATFRSALRHITVVWALVFVAEALARVGLALVLTADQVMLISPIMGFVATLPLIGFTRFRMGAMRKRLERVDQVRWPL